VIGNKAVQEYGEKYGNIGEGSKKGIEKNDRKGDLREWWE
jgi:hypothetical protein